VQFYSEILTNNRTSATAEDGKSTAINRNVHLTSRCKSTVAWCCSSYEYSPPLWHAYHMHSEWCAAQRAWNWDMDSHDVLGNAITR